MAEPKYLRTEDAARYLSVSPRTLEKWRRQGIGPEHVSLGARLKAYTVEALDQWATRKAQAA